MHACQSLIRLACPLRLLTYPQAPPVALRSVLEGEIRAFAAHQGVDGHRQCMRKFLELLLARGETPLINQFLGRKKTVLIQQLRFCKHFLSGYKLLRA